MPDLLAHALIAYTLAVLLSWRYDWLTRPYVTVSMAGALIPDMAKIRLLLPSKQVELLGIPMDVQGLHTGGAALLSVLIGVSVVAPRHRKRVFALLSLGAASHLVADAFVLTVSGRSYAIFFPLTPYRPPTPGLYASTQPEPTILAAVAALLVWLATRYRVADRGGNRSQHPEYGKNE